MHYFHTCITIIFILAPPDTESEVEEVDQIDSQALDKELILQEGPQNTKACELYDTFLSFNITLSITVIVWLIFHHILHYINISLLDVEVEPKSVKAKTTKLSFKVKTVKHVVHDDPSDLSGKCILVQI